MFIVLYGVNNIGKTTQAELLSKKLSGDGIKNEYIKYPIYDLGPSGKILNNYLRQGNKYKLSARENQLIHTINKTQFQPILKQKLKSGTTIIAEDYIGTSIAWGISSLISQEFLEDTNSHLIKEDLAFLLSGDRFKKAIEKNNKHENNQKLIERVQNNFLNLANHGKNNWKIIDANKSIQEIHAKIYKKIKKYL